MRRITYRPARLKIKDWRKRLANIERRREHGEPLADACAAFSISRSTYWHWCQRINSISAKQQERK
jgi:hypothetical protein